MYIVLNYLVCSRESVKWETTFTGNRYKQEITGPSNCHLKNTLNECATGLHEFSIHTRLTGGARFVR